MRNADPYQVYRPEDLQDLSLATVPLAVFGDPVKHSLSPVMHNAALAAMAEHDPRFRQWCYYKFAVRAEDVVAVLPRFREAGFRGINLTIPHKTVVCQSLDSLDEEARTMGAVNTLVWQQGQYHGCNTDGFGLKSAVRGELGIDLSSQPVILLGAGGAARAAAVQCLLDGVPALHLGNRDAGRLGQLTDLLHRVRPDIPVHGFRLGENPPANLPTGALVINATSLGLQATDPAPLDLSRIPQPIGLYDMIYNPAETLLIRAARQAGIPAANGLAMLVWQGVRSLEIWSGEKVPAAVMRAACEKALAMSS